MYTIDKENNFLNHDQIEYINPPKEVKEYILWGIWDDIPSRDMARPPIQSGCVFSREEIFDIAKKYGLDDKINFNNDYVWNKRLVEGGLLNHKNKTIHAYATKKGQISYYEWRSFLDYILNREPCLKLENISKKEIVERIVQSQRENLNYDDLDFESHCDSMLRLFGNSFNNSYIGGYIRKNEAKRKSIVTDNSKGPKIEIVEFLYTQFLYAGKQVRWNRHRIVKYTEKYLYVEKMPYSGGGYLDENWKNFVIYTCRINKLELDEKGFFYVKADIYLTFYTSQKLKEIIAKSNVKNYFKKIKDRMFNGFDEADPIMVIPDAELAWALSFFEILETELNETIVKKAFVKMSFKHHPDMGGDAKEFIKCIAARDFLLDYLSRYGGLTK